MVITVRVVLSASGSVIFGGTPSVRLLRNSVVVGVVVVVVVVVVSNSRKERNIMDNNRYTL